MTGPSSLSYHTIVARGTGLIEAEVDGETLAMDIDDDVLYGLNKTGSQIWRMLAEPQRIDAICAHLTAKYAVDAATCERQVLDLLEELLAEGLVEVRENSTSPRVRGEVD